MGAYRLGHSSVSSGFGVARRNPRKSELSRAVGDGLMAMKQAGGHPSRDALQLATLTLLQIWRTPLKLNSAS